MKPITQRARQLRSNATDAERRLWRALRLRRVNGYKFRRQYPLGAFIVDFVCLERRLIIEVDGNHHAEQAEYDANRERSLCARGFEVLRFSNRDVLTALPSVEEAILLALSPGSPPP